jgi:hypothetical protein
MESTIKFETWLLEHGFDQLHWSGELRKSLEQRFRRENPPRIVVDCRGADWPVKVYRVEVKL